jgi:hypothetical protein
VRFYEIPEEAGGKRYRAEMVGDILAIDLKQQLEATGLHQMQTSHRGPRPSRRRGRTGHNGGRGERRGTLPAAASNRAADGRT